MGRTGEDWGVTCARARDDDGGVTTGARSGEDGCVKSAGARDGDGGFTDGGAAVGDLSALLSAEDAEDVFWDLSTAPPIARSTSISNSDSVFSSFF